jgi:hypothetical protein
MPGYIIHAESSWLDFHIGNSVGKEIVYCRGVGAPMKNVRNEGKLFFLRGGTSPKRVEAWADFLSAEEVKVAAAWERFGTALGAGSETGWRALIDKLPRIKAAGRFIAIRARHFAVPAERVGLAEVGVPVVEHATKGWSVDQEDVDRILGRRVNDARDLVPPSRQGYIRDAAFRRAVELRAMEAAKAHYAGLGFDRITDTSATEPFDLVCVDKTAREVRVEVKGSRTAGGEVLVTAGEVAEARRFSGRTDLFVWGFVEVVREEDQLRGVGGHRVGFVEHWRPEEENLIPTQYRYRLPASTSSA